MGKKKIGKITVPKHGTQLERIEEMLSTIGLNDCVGSFQFIEEQVQANHGTHFDYLEQLLEHELQNREESRIARWLSSAKIKQLSTIQDYDFELQPSIDPVVINELASCRFIDQGKNVFFLGPQGIGKTHLSVAIAYEAIKKGYDVRFMPINTFQEEHDKNDDKGLSRFFKTLVSPKLLILDDIDYYTTKEEAGVFLFDVIKQRYDEKLSTIISSNKNPKDWGNLFGPERTKAALDRLFDHRRVVVIKAIGGKSYRTPHMPDDYLTIAEPIGNRNDKRFLKKVTTVFSRD